MLGNSVTYQALITKITKAGKKHDIAQQTWWSGRMATLIIHFEPIDDEDFEDSYTGQTSAVVSGKTKSSSTITPIEDKLFSYTPKLRQS